MVRRLKNHTSSFQPKIMTQRYPVNLETASSVTNLHKFNLRINRPTPPNTVRRQRLLLRYPPMALPTDLNIESLTYTHADLRRKWFYLDRLLDRMAPVFLINDPTPPTRDLRGLTSLPNELLLDILQDLSIVDLMRLRRCNRYLNYFVSTISPLRTALRIAPNTAKGIVAMQVSLHITATQLCQKLYQRECDVCGMLAQCINLSACLRLCFNCTNFVPDMSISSDTMDNMPCTEEEMVHEFRVRPEQLAVWPSFRPLLGTFTNGINKFKMEERHTLYECPKGRLIKKLGWSPLRHDGANASELAMEYYDRQELMSKGYPDLGTVTVLRDPLHYSLYPHMSIVIAPWPDSTASNAEQGIFCSTCLGTRNEHVLYTRDAFLEHLKDCRVEPHNSLIDLRDPLLWLCEDDE